MQVGTTKDQGLFSKPSAALHPGALAAGTLPPYKLVEGVKNCSSFLVIHLLQFYYFYAFSTNFQFTASSFPTYMATILKVAYISRESENL